jgi:hypothetical protein
MDTRSLLIGLIAITAAPASAQNLVVNGDFETGTLDPWIDTFGNFLTTPVLPIIISGDFSASAVTFPDAPLASLRQFVTPLDGVTYQLDFSYGNYINSARLRVTFAGVEVLDRVLAHGETGSYSHIFTGDGLEGSLDFAVFAVDGSVFVMDDVRIIPADIPTGIPEPATWALFVAGFGVAGTALRQRRRTPAL